MKSTLTTDNILWAKRHTDHLFERIVKHFELGGDFNPLNEHLIDSQQNWPVPFFKSIDLGVIEVPPDYVHETQLATFYKKNAAHMKGILVEGKSLPHLLDSEHANSRKLKPGDKFKTSIFCTNIYSCKGKAVIDFIRRNRSQAFCLLGAQGASLVFEQKRDLLPKGPSTEMRSIWYETPKEFEIRGFKYSSFDLEENLPCPHSNGRHGIPTIYSNTECFEFGAIDAFCDGVFNNILCFQEIH